VHVLQYLWDAAALPARADFVARTARYLLDHHPVGAIADLKGHYDALAQTGKLAPELKRCIDDLTANSPASSTASR
jgi:hypothetical protein